ncbi:CHAP domain-containing protein [Streptomyces finlayi]|uniref:CHAP domain-containing protein n=1 Tax=Streptomyces finlayi TaxID=67296 RepID=A0A7G7BF91_9ACTN|nr:peptidoglycan-binding protein [Streptomyces finlayi]QNE74006.1 CHAP domain-containing protein [Streptomyces finlayi]
MTKILTALGAIAKAEIGYREGKSNGRWNNAQKFSKEVPGLEWSDYQAWCATFVSWVALKAGAADLFPRTASCWAGVQWFKRAGRFSEYPAIGAQVFFGSGGGSHTGLVYAYDADYIYTYEGNTNGNGSAEGDGVYAKKRARRDAYTYGYGYPDLPGGVSADPKAAKFGYKVAATAKLPAPAKPKPKYEPFPGSAFFKGKPKSSIVTALGKRLVAVGCSAYKSGPGPQWSDADKASYAKWQRKCGYTGADADGWPGKSSWDKLKVPKV